MDRDITLLFVGAGIALGSSLLTALISELIKFYIEAKNRRINARNELLRGIEKFSLRIQLLTPGSDFDLEESLEELTTKPVAKMREQDIARALGILEGLYDEKNFQLFVEDITEKSNKSIKVK